LVFSNEDEARLAKEKFIEEQIPEGYINCKPTYFIYDFLTDKK